VKAFLEIFAQFNVPGSKERALLLCTAVSLVAVALIRFAKPEAMAPDQSGRLAASRHMEKTLSVLRGCYVSRGFQFDEVLDLNHTGLVGPEVTDMVTTLGSIEAKRSTTNPNVAGLLVAMLEEGGVVRGDTIAVGCSGSFPALAIAAISASQALGIHPVMIVSLGSSSFGANRTEWTLLDILESMRGAGLTEVVPAAVSLGGARDVGREFEPETKAALMKKISRSGLTFLNESDLRQNVAGRMAVYFGPSGKRKISAFVNIGGSFADLGTDPAILKLEPGVNRTMQLPEHEERYGVVFAMAKRHIPVIHILHIKGLLLKYGLPWDPVPLPAVSEDRHVQARSGIITVTGVVTATYFCLIILIFVSFRKAFFRTYS
jgi:poly-gamma-glutamate system protein